MNNYFAPLFAKSKMDELMKRRFRNVQLLLQRLYFLLFQPAFVVIQLFWKKKTWTLNYNEGNYNSVLCEPFPRFDWKQSYAMKHEFDMQNSTINEV